MTEEIYYILYDNKRIHWFLKKEKTDKRNLKAMKNQIEASEGIIGKEIYLNKRQEIYIKRMLLKPSKEIIFLLETEKPIQKPIKFPENFL